jgi:quercetin dioxygenase-like cupin family protein
MLSAASPTTSSLERSQLVSLMGGVIGVRVDGAQTDGTFALLDQLLPQDAATPLHVHPDQDETFYVISGQITVYRDGALSTASAGDVVSLPRGIPHAFRVDSERAHVLDITTPAGHEQFFRLAGEPTDAFALGESGPPDLARMALAAEQSGLELLGPPPFDAR